MFVPLTCLAALIAGVLGVGGVAAWLAFAAAVTSCVPLAARSQRSAAWVLVAAAMCAAHGAHARRMALDPPMVTALEQVLDDRQAAPVLVTGVLHEDAAVEVDGVRLSIDVDRINIEARGWRQIRGRAQVGVGGTVAMGLAGEWVRGRRVTAPVLVKRPQMWRNPGSPSEAWQRLRRGSDVSGSVKSGALVAVTRGGWWSEAGARVRAHVRATLARTVGPASSESASIVTAILIGDRTGLDDSTVRRLQSAGTYHVIAISGGNIAIVVIACLMVLRGFVRSPRLSAAITLLVVLAYGALVGDQASVSRAVTAGALVLGLQVVGWCAPTLQIFALAALCVALVDPLTVVDVGAWLSFGATLGILLFGRDLHQRLSLSRGRVVDAGVAMFAATLAAELALMPISAAVFSRVSVAGLLLNFVAIPAMAVTQLAGTAIVIVADVWPAVGGLAAQLAHGGAVALVRSAHLLDIAPWLSWQTPPVWWGWTILYYVGLLGSLWGRRHRRTGLAFAGVAACAWLVIVIAPNAPSRLPSAGHLRISMLDVGQGQAIAVQFPTGQSLLVDAGGTGTGFDIGARVVEPALWALGVQRLDWLALTHGDGDHVGGAASVLRDMAPREVWEGIPVPRDRRLQSLRDQAQAQHTIWRRLLAGGSFEAGSALVEVVHPPPADWERQDVRNDDSLVLRVTFGQVSLLLTGDVGQPVEETMAFDRSPRLRLVTAPHHGSRTSSSAALVRGLLPHAVFVSAGRGNTFGHPAPDVLQRYRDAGVEVFRTDVDGAIVIDSDGRGVSVRTMAGRTWQLSAATLGGAGE